MTTPSEIRSPGEFMRQELWQTTDDQVLRARRQLRHQLASAASSPRNITDTAVSCFGGISAKLLESARALLLLSRNRPDASHQATQVGNDLHSRLVAARKALLKEITAGLTKRDARRLRQQTLPRLDTQIANIMREFSEIGHDLEQIEFTPTKRQTTRALNRQVEILFLAADPRQTTSGVRKPSAGLLELDEEYRAIQQRIRQGSHRDYIDLKAHLAVRPQDLLDALNQHRPRVVHFSGHGTSSEGIVLLTPDGRPEPVGADFLVRVFSTLTSSTSLVVLNACYSKAQADAISKVVGVTIGTEATIADEDAIAFSEALYGALANNLSIDDAFHQAEAILASVRRRERPRLVIRPGLPPAHLHLIKVPDSKNYEPLGRSLSEAMNLFVAKREIHLTALASIADSCDLAGTLFSQTEMSTEHRKRIRAVQEGLPRVLAELRQESNDFGQRLDGIGRRWSVHLTVEASSRLSKLEEAVSARKDAIERYGQPLLELEMRHIDSDPGGLLPSLSGTVRELEVMARTSWNLVSTRYNMLLEFLPGDLLDKGIVKLIEVDL